MLLSYLLTCEACGGGFSKISATHYGCSTARNKGTCANRLRIAQNELEDMVLGALQLRLMDPELLKKFCEELSQSLFHFSSSSHLSGIHYIPEGVQQQEEVKKG